MAKKYLQELVIGYPPILKWSNVELNLDQGPTIYTNEGKNRADILLGKICPSLLIRVVAFLPQMTKKQDK